MSEGIGGLVRDLRLSQRMSLRELAKVAGISAGALSYWEAGRSEPCIPELEAVLGALNASPSARQEAYARIHAPRALARLRNAPLLTGCASAEVFPLPASGDLLRALRHRRGMFLEQAAAILQVQPSTISRWEKSRAWPSEERLDAYCALLGAAPEERQALRRISLTSSAMCESDTLPLEALEQQFEQLQRDAIGGESALMDLRFLSLEAALWHRALRNRTARSLLAKTYAWHAQWLLWRERLAEAGQISRQALEMAQQAGRPERFWFRAVYVQASCLAEGARGPVPKRGEQFVEDWLPVVRWADTESWMHHVIAAYAMQSGQKEKALASIARAQTAADRSESLKAVRHSCLDSAMILCKAGRFHEARALLSTDDHPNVHHRAYQALAWAITLHGLGDFARAREWSQRVCEIVRAYDLSIYRYMTPLEGCL